MQVPDFLIDLSKEPLRKIWQVDSLRLKPGEVL